MTSRPWSHGYQPNGTLRHLVQVRDGKCAFPSCTSHARESDFGHAVPASTGKLRLPGLPQGGRVLRVIVKDTPARL